ncbi:MAG: uridine phosphorylase [Thermodesulfobacteriota bacterium]
MEKVYHLDLDKKMLQGATVALLPGDPARSGAIAEAIAKAYGGSIKKLASKREFVTHLSSVGKTPVIVTSTGIGGPSTAIAIDELARLGIKSFIRVGTTGSIQNTINMGDVIITTGSVRLDGASCHYAPIEYPAVADFSLVAMLVEGAKKSRVPYHTGVTVSSDTFYPGEERGDSYRKYIIKTLQGATKEWRNLHALNYEMESATLLTMTSSMGLKGACVTGVVNRGGVGKVSPANLKLGEKNAITVAINSLKEITRLL